MTTRKTYELPIPTNTRDSWSTWFTRHLIDIENNQVVHDGYVTHLRPRKTINIDIQGYEQLTLDYADAERVGLALLAAVEEAKRARDKEMGK